MPLLTFASEPESPDALLELIADADDDAWVAFAPSVEPDLGRLEDAGSDVCLALVEAANEVSRHAPADRAPWRVEGATVVDTSDAHPVVLVTSLSGAVVRVSALRRHAPGARTMSEVARTLLARHPRVLVVTGGAAPARPPFPAQRVLAELEAVAAAASAPDAPAWRSDHALLVLRDLYERETAVRTRATGAAAEVAHRIQDLTARVLRALAAADIIDYRATPLRAELRALFLALRGDAVPAVAHTTVRGPARATELRFLHLGRDATERFTSPDGEVRPLDAKWRRIPYFGQELLWERIVWLPGDGPFTVEIDGVQARVGDRGYPAFRSAATPQASLTPRRPRSVARQLRSALGRRLRPGASPAHADPMPTESSQYTAAWLLMDRVDRAGDNAEALYWHLRTHEPAVNAWFVLGTDSPDLQRMRDAGARVLEYRSAEHLEALARAEIVASSFVDAEMTHPVSDTVYPGARRPWRFVYLQHGVLHTDLSLWFNTKPIDLMVTAMEAERDALVSDGSPYLLSRQTVALTGFPRHDRLRALRAEAGERDVLLLAPTWRLGLSEAHGADAHLTGSAFFREWTGLARDAHLRRLAAMHGLRVILMPHPNMRAALSQATITDIEIADEHTHPEALLARARVLVTDYSSIAFDAPVSGAAVTYFQFDADEVFGGSHTFTPGAFDYARDGLGPVAHTIPAAVDAIAAVLDDTAGHYAARHEAVRAHADGDAARRVVAAIRDLLD